MTNKRITLQDIAESLGISKNSVSRALSGKSGVSNKTRKKVIDAADRLGYTYEPIKPQKNQVANIALIASDLAFSNKTNFFGNIYLSVQNEVQKHGMNLLIKSISETDVDNLLVPDFIEDNSVDGILILSHITTNYINKIISSGIPTVLIDHHHPNINADAILTDNRFGAYRAIEYLIKKNHKYIGFIGNTSFSPSYYERFQGYHMALEDFFMPINNDFIFKETPDDEDLITNYFNNLKEMPTAWFCANDRLGYIVTNNLKSRGYSIPKDISVFSFDNGQLSKLASPKLTTMDIDLQYFGQKGVEHLLWRINHADEPTQNIVIHPEIIERESVDER